MGGVMAGPGPLADLADPLADPCSRSVLAAVQNPDPELTIGFLVFVVDFQ